MLRKHYLFSRISLCLRHEEKANILLAGIIELASELHEGNNLDSNIF